MVDSRSATCVRCLECKYHEVLTNSARCGLCSLFNLPEDFECTGGKRTELYHDDLYDDDPRPIPTPDLSIPIPTPKSEPTSTEEIENKLMGLAQEADNLSLDLNNLELEAEITQRQRASLERQAKVLSEKLSQLKGRLSVVTSNRAYYTLKLEASEGRN